MKYKINHFVAALFFVLSLNVSAEYKTTNFTQEEYQKVSKTSGEYSNCLNETALAQIDKEDDTRVIADYAMKNCAPILEKTYEYLVSENYAPEAVRRVLGSVANRASNKLLRRLMQAMATRKP